VEIDLLLLSRDLSPPRSDVWNAIQTQERVTVRVVRITGPARPGDRNRLETIARARNDGKRLASTQFVMLLDDDVVLGPRCMASLAEGLAHRPEFAALAADSAGDMNSGLDHWDYPRHVGMAAILFRRERLETLTWRWEPEKCECRCCCDDLRRAGHAIGYMPGAQAWHRPSHSTAPAANGATSLHCKETQRGSNQPRPVPSAAAPPLPGRILAAFNREHLRLFVRRFLRTLRSEGNSETVTAVTTGLRSSDRSVLARMAGVEVVDVPDDGHPARQRLRNFQHVVARWPADTPVAYWDAGDVVFQDRIAPLWDLVRANPDRLLAATEVTPFWDGTVIWWWIETIKDPEARARAMALLKGVRTLNSGFAAGTARTMLTYLRAADKLMNSPALHGTTDFGDQTAMNLYCRSNPAAWLEIPSGWNYSLSGLGPRDYRVTPDGRTERFDGEPLHVVHGAGGHLRRWDLVHLSA
jgi:hypothetical protein